MNLTSRRLNKSAATSFALLATFSCINAPASPAPNAHQLQVRIAPQFKGAPLSFDRVDHTTAGGQRISVTRLDFLLSELCILNEAGCWLPLASGQDQVAYISGREGQTTFRSGRIPDGRYTALKFNVGLPPSLNHSDPARYSAT